jgi:hypothetical protein
MPDTQKFVVIPDPDNVGITFANQVIAAGHHNGVVNMSFAVARFSPNAQGVVDPDFKVAARLRFDVAVAMQMHEHLTRILGQVQASVDQALATAAVSSTVVVSRGKSN